MTLLIGLTFHHLNKSMELKIPHGTKCARRRPAKMVNEIILVMDLRSNTGLGKKIGQLTRYLDKEKYLSFPPCKPPMLMGNGGDCQ